eukprot:jgi/Ulvmu1/7468/UM037_0011.1
MTATCRPMQRVQSCVGCVRPLLRRSPTLARTASSSSMCRGQLCIAHADAFKGSPLHDDMIEALKAVRLASTACMAVQRTLATTNINTKDDDSPVTVADYAAQALVAWALQRSSSDRLKLVAEEDSAELRDPAQAGMLSDVCKVFNTTLAQVVTDAPLMSTGEVCELIDLGDSEGGPGQHWVLDPIDGTRGFEAARQYSVCLGMIQDGEPVLGVLGCPNMPLDKFGTDDGGPSPDAGTVRDGYGTIFAALKSQGTFEGPLNSTECPSKQLQAAELPSIQDALFMESYDSRHSRHTVTSSIATTLELANPPLRLDSQCKYGLLARGDGNIFMRFPDPSYREKIWDHVPGVVVFQEAGGVVTDGTGVPLDFGLGRYLDGMQKGIVASTPAVHAKVIEAAANSPDA